MSHRRRLAVAASIVGLGASSAGDRAHAQVVPDLTPEVESAARAADRAWCAPGLEVLPAGVCHYSPEVLADPRTLVIFLHGVIKPDTTWQHTQQRAIARLAKVHRFAALAPRGRRGIGPRKMTDWYTWPTAHRAQLRLEGEVVAEWAEARRLVEEKAGEPFERLLVFGFSNGAYYATSLAMRDRLPDVDGYAVFAGGGAPSYLRKHGARAARRAPIYVGYGLRDRAHRDPERLGRVLERIGWPSRARARRRAGHAMTDFMVRDALEFFATVLPENER